MREFIQRGSQWLAYKHQVSGEAWEYTFDGYDPQSEKLREALCTLGNGYFATRGAAPESKAGQTHYPGTYAAGVYNRLVDDVSGTQIDNESLVNLPNWLGLTFRIDGGTWFDIDAVDVLSYRQTLDLRGRGADKGGSVPRRRRPHEFTAATTIRRDAHAPRRRPRDDDHRRGASPSTIEIRSTLDGNVTNSLVERYRDLADEHLGSVDKREIAADSVLLTMQTTESRIPVAMAARSTIWRDWVVVATYRLFDENAEIGHDITVRLSIGEAVTVEKLRMLNTGRDVATVRTRCRRRALAPSTRPVRQVARRASDRMDASVGAAVHRIRRLRRRTADPAPASAAPAADRVTEHR